MAVVWLQFTDSWSSVLLQHRVHREAKARAEAGWRSSARGHGGGRRRGGGSRG